MRLPCLTDFEWSLLQPLLPPPAQRGHPRVRDLREILNGIFICCVPVALGECGPGNSARGPRSMIIIGAGGGKACGSRSTTPCASGYDAGKKVEGHKRHVVVDTLGLLLLVMVGPANVQDRDGARPLLSAVLARARGLQKIWADGGYAGALVAWFQTQVAERPCGLESVRHRGDKTGFYIWPKRWIVERTLGWLVKSRRLARDYETLTHSSEAMIYLAMIRLMLKRLANPKG